MSAFASDNYAGVHPDVLAAIGAADALGHVVAYGADPVTERAVAKVREHLGEEAHVFFVWGGTAANVTLTPNATTVVALRSARMAGPSMFAPACNASTWNRRASRRPAASSSARQYMLRVASGIAS